MCIYHNQYTEYNRKWNNYITGVEIVKGRILLRSKLPGSEHGKAETLRNQRNYQ